MESNEEQCSDRIHRQFGESSSNCSILYCWDDIVVPQLEKLLQIHFEKCFENVGGNGGGEEEVICKVGGETLVVVVGDLLWVGGVTTEENLPPLPVC